MLKINFQRVVWVSILSITLTACGGGGDNDSDVSAGNGPVAVTESTPVAEGMAFAQQAVKASSSDTDEPRPIDQAQLAESDTDEPDDNI